jgi:hypothetical protein
MRKIKTIAFFISISALLLLSVPGFYSPATSGTVASQASAFSPTDIAGCQLWLDADAITGLTDGDPVATWSDQSGNSNDATQSTSGARPLYKTSIINGKPVLRFDGTDDCLVQTYEDFQDDNYTVFIVSKTTNTTNGDNWYLSNTNSSTNYPFLLIGNSTTTLCFLNRDDAQHVISIEKTNMTANPYLLTTKRSASNSHSFYINGSLFSTDTTDIGTTTTDSYRIGANVMKGEVRYADCDIAEILIYDTALSDTDRAKVETYLNDKYNIY